MIARAVEARARGQRTLSVWGAGRAHRDVLYADDAANALIAIAESGLAEPVNVASGLNRTVADIARVIAAEAGLDDIAFDTTKPEGALSRAVNIAKLAALGFSPKIPLAEGVRRTMADYVVRRRDQE
jgi:GDP-L-fucose synthase